MQGQFELRRFTVKEKVNEFETECIWELSFFSVYIILLSENEIKKNGSCWQYDTFYRLPVCIHELLHIRDRLLVLFYNLSKELANIIMLRCNTSICNRVCKHIIKNNLYDVIEGGSYRPDM